MAILAKKIHKNDNTPLIYKKKKERLFTTGFVFILPAFIGFLLFMIYPLFYSLFLSFMDWNMIIPSKSTFTGLDNYIAAFHNEYFLIGVWNNIKVAVLAVPVLIVLSLLVAVLLNTEVFGTSALRTAYFLPYITTVTAAAVVFSALLHPVYGPVNMFLRSVGIDNPPGWATSSDWSLFTVAMFWIWKNMGYCIVIFLAGLQGISKTYYEASLIDGASKKDQFFKITVPLISPTTFFLFITCVIQSFQLFAEVNVLTAGGPGRSSYTTVMHIYNEGFVRFHMGYASAVSWLFFLLILLVTVIQWKYQNKWVKYV
jgi:multiple sugar transport system permease protein